MSQSVGSWTPVSLGNLASKIGSGATPRGGEQVYKSSGVPLIRSMNVYIEGFRADGLAYLDDDQAEALRGATVRTGDVLLNITGASIGRVTQAPPSMDGARVNQHVCIIRLKEGVEPTFIARYLASPRVQSFIAGENYGVTRQALTKQMVEGLAIPLPPLPVQRRIVAKLDSLFARTKAAREELARVTKLVERYKQAVLEKAFRGELTADWRKGRTEAPGDELVRSLATSRTAACCVAGIREKPALAPTWRPNIDLPDSWAIASVDQLSILVQYGSSAKTTESPEDSVPVLRMGNIVDGQLNFTNLKYLPITHDEFPELLLKEGDILFNRTNSPELVGKCAAFTNAVRPTSFASYLIRVRSFEYLPELLSAYINSRFGREWVRSVVNQQVGQANVNGTKLRELGVPLMAMEEQQELWKRIRLAFSQIKAMENECTGATALLDRLDQATLAKAFRGELVSEEEHADALASIV
jgi:type I restriction enzyme S subunit